MNTYYVYQYLRSKDSDQGKSGTPYYVGKGKSKRAWVKKRTVPMPTDESMIVLVAENLTESEAFELEKSLISQWGRLDNGTGCLRNLTDGGEGCSGRKLSAESISKRSEAWKRSYSTLSKEEKSERSKKAHKAWMDMSTPEQRSDIGKKVNAYRSSEEKSICAKKFWASMTDEEKSQRGKKSSKKRWEEMSDDRKIELAKKISASKIAFWASLSEEERKERTKKFSNSRSKEERSKTTKNQWSKLSKQQRSEATQKARNACTLEKRIEVAKNRWSKMSPEERSDAGKRSAATRIARQREKSLMDSGINNSRGAKCQE